MSTLINASCPVCGEVSLTPRDITLNVSARVPERSHYLFTCPKCNDRVEKPAPANVIGLLAHGGVVNKTPWEPPTHPERKPAYTAPLTEDDLITFGILLHGAVDIARWAR